MNLIKPKYGQTKIIILEAHKKGLTSRDVRSKYLITKSNINNQLRMLGIKLKPVRPNWGGSRTYASTTK
jgi:hypothetical protein